MKPTDEILIVDDLFDELTVNQLYKECQTHFEKNLMFDDDIEITNSIVDCHGLALSESMYFPYSVNCWNILCLKIKKYVVEYCNKFGYDESFVIPFSCWAERSATETTVDPDLLDGYKYVLYEGGVFKDDGFEYFRDRPQKVEDHQVKKHLLRSVYNLHSPDPFFGTSVFFPSGERRIPAKPNRLIIYDGGSYPSTHYYPRKGSNTFYFEDHSVGKYNIVFDWYINEPFDVPDWILP
jgi:hypothetical protein